MTLRAQRFSFLMEGKVAGEGLLDFLHIRQASARKSERTYFGLVLYADSGVPEFLGVGAAALELL